MLALDLVIYAANHVDFEVLRQISRVGTGVADLLGHLQIILECLGILSKSTTT